jgi:hypothetical protein
MSKEDGMLERVNKTLGRVMIAGEEKSWDHGFLESIAEQLGKGRTLSPSQERILQKIEGRFSAEALASRATWSKDWDEEKEVKFSIALQYYAKTGYYGSIVYRYLNASLQRLEGIPSHKEYNKLVNNKYAAGVISNLLAEKPFPIGTHVEFRNAYTTNRTLRGRPCIVLKYGDVSKVHSHAKNAIPVLVAPIGEPEPVWTEVRHLKKARKRR